MDYNKDELQKCFINYRDFLSTSRIPLWDELPKIDLYMDQVIEIINDYISVFKNFNDSATITPTMINNYVKHKIMPAPAKKKYSKIHLAYIIMICVLKQTLNISTIQKLLPCDVTEEEAKKTYDSFVKNQYKAFAYVLQEVEKAAKPVFESNSEDSEKINSIVMQVAASANILKCITENVIGLMPKN
ncbi:MAG: DUF1836 domain-containing protein [Firmicutes bacterium]|nr:DUF1836 domain-containing protein [Bacillota bacterium]